MTHAVAMHACIAQQPQLLEIEAKVLSNLPIGGSPKGGWSGWQHMFFLGGFEKNNWGKKPNATSKKVQLDTLDKDLTIGKKRKLTMPKMMIECRIESPVDVLRKKNFWGQKNITNPQVLLFRPGPRSLKSNDPRAPYLKH